MTITVDQLLATLAIDDAAGVAVSGRVALILRDPQPSEDGISIDSTVLVRAVDLEGDPAAPLWGFVLKVEIDTGSGYVVAFDGLSFDPAWSGARSTASAGTAADPYVWIEAECDQAPAVFTSEQVVGVRVSAGFSGGYGLGPYGTGAYGSTTPPVTDFIVEEYTFTAEDLTAPRLISAEPQDQTTLRVRFNEAMQTNPDGENAVIVGTLSEPFSFAGGETLDLRVDGETAQTMEFLVSNFVDPSNATAAEVASAIFAAFTGITALDDGTGKVKVITDSEGDAASAQISGGTAASIIGFSSTVVVGQSLSVLAPENFSIARNTVRPFAAVNLSVESAVAVDTDGEEFDLTLNWEMTPNAPYTVTVDGDVEDVSGNVIDPDWVTADFIGHQPPIPEGRRFDLWKFIPQENREQDNAGTGDLRAFINVLQEVCDLLLYEIDRFPDQYDPDKATPEQIRAMLYDMGNPFADWSELELTELQEKKLLRILVNIYKLKGTAVGIESVVRFLLGVDVEVVDYISDGWVLGVDELGNGSQAEVISGATETFDFSGVDRAIWIGVDGANPIAGVSVGDGEFTIYGEKADQFVAGHVFQVVDSSGNDATYTVAAQGSGEVSGTTVIPVVGTIPDATVDGVIVQRVPFSSTAGVDFATPASATAQEVADVIEANLLDGGAYAPLIGTQATVEGTVASPFALSPGDQLFFKINDPAVRTVTFDGTETTAADVLEKITAQLAAFGAEGFPVVGNKIGVRTLVYGSTQSLEVVAGGVEAALGLAVGIYAGTDLARVVITSDTTGHGSAIEVYGGTAATVLDFSAGVSGGAGGAELAPGDAYTLYSFDVVSEDPLSSTEELIIRRIAEYMKPAHTHLRRITQPSAPTPAEGWALGVSTLGDESELLE